MSTRLRVINFLGGCYAVFAVVTFMVAVETIPTDVSAKASRVAQVSQGLVLNSERLSDDQGDTRSQYWITIWTTRNCAACERQKALVPALEAAGYHVIVRRVPGQRWIKSFPALVITKDKPSGDALHTLYGVYTVEKLDSILEIGEAPEEEVDEDPDYDIFSPKPHEYRYSVVAYVFDNDEGKEQFKELSNLRDYNICSVLTFVVMENVGQIQVVLIDNNTDRVIGHWSKLVTEHVILMTIQGRT